jgi:hypothetical protein
VRTRSTAGRARQPRRNRRQLSREHAHCARQPRRRGC